MTSVESPQSSPTTSISTGEFDIQYEIMDAVGKGSFGTVHRVRRRRDDKIVVAKALRYGQMTEREKLLLVSEVNLLKRLRHANIVKYYDRIVDWQQATLYIIMEFCEAGDLGSLIKTCKHERSAIQEDVIWNIVAQIVAALKHCHSGTDEVVLHRDIKPGNIFLDATGNVKLGDFGLARVLSADSLFAQTWVGTPFYMSPEQVDGLAYNEKSDIWALGCLTYELASLRPPFSGANPLALARSIKTGRFPRIPAQYSNDLARFIAKLLAVDANARPTADELEKISQIQLFNRECRLKSHYAVLKKREEDLATRERRLVQREQELARKQLRFATQLKLAGIDSDDTTDTLVQTLSDCNLANAKENRADQPSPFA